MMSRMVVSVYGAVNHLLFAAALNNSAFPAAFWRVSLESVPSVSNAH